MQDVMDFSNLAQGKDFTFGKEKYHIPSYTKDEMLKLVSMSSEMVKESKDKKKSSASDPSKDTAKGSEEDEDSAGNLRKVFDAQAKYICSGIKKYEGESLVDVSEDAIKGWPMKLQNKVMQLINQTITEINETVKLEEQSVERPT